MKKFTSMLVLAAMGVSILAGCGGQTQTQTPSTPSSSGQTNSPDSTSTPNNAEETRTEAITLRWGATGAANSNSNQYVTAEYVMNYITEKTGGMIQFEYYPSQQLGGEASMFDQITSDTLDLATVQPTTLSNVWRDFEVMSFPFAYPSVESYWKVFNNDEMFDYWENTMNGAAHYIGIVNCAYRGMQNTRREIRSAADLNGMTIRVQSGEIYKAVFGALGASTATLETSELFTALQQGVVDGEDNIPTYVLSNSFYEVDKYTTELNAIVSCAQLIMAPSTWDKLLPSERALFREALMNCEQLQIDFYNDMINDCYAQLAENGMTVTRIADLSDEEYQTFVDAMNPVWSQFEGDISPDFYAVWQAKVEQAR